MAIPKRCCRRLFTIAILILAIIGGGLVLWRFLPEGSKASLSSIQQAPQAPVYEFQKCNTNSTECCNGLDTICDLRADQILYAGLHNAHAARENGFLIAPNHQLGLESALIAGYRAINLDIARCGGDDDGKLLLIHGRCALGYREPLVVLQNINDFLTANPSETILLIIQVVQEESTENPITLEEIDDLIHEIDGLPNKLYNHTSRSLPWPTLRELRQAGKQITLFHYNVGGYCRDGTVEGGTCPTGFHDWFTYAKETEYSFASVAEIKDTEQSCKLTRGTRRATFFAVNMFVTLPNREASSELNSIEFVREHAKACQELNNDQPVTVIFIDFFTRGNLPLYVQRQNTIRASGSGNIFDRYLRGWL